MNNKTIFSVAALLAGFTMSSCSLVSQIGNPAPPKGYIAPTDALKVDRNDCRMVCTQLVGESKGFSLLGFIPIKQPSEVVAVKRMYDNATRRGAQIEGRSAQFANRSIEHSSNYYVLWSRPTIKSSGDLVEYLPGAKSKTAD